MNFMKKFLIRGGIKGEIETLKRVRALLLPILNPFIKP